MKVVTTKDEVRAWRRASDQPVGLVPTMGFLHDGHLSLVRRARTECPRTAASIFVNPTQFGPEEDLESYPRDLPRDLGLLEAEGVDLVWTPTQDEMYGEAFQSWVTVELVSQPLEGAERPGHFRGVATVVSKLFHVFEPQRAYFGQKDAQQAIVLRRMARDLDFPVEVVVCPTVREADGLAMSSRNTYLSPDERRAAPVLYRALSAAGKAFDGGVKEADGLRLMMYETLLAEPLAKTQYVSVADPETLEEQFGTLHRALVSLAVFIGKTRLIDNILLGGDRSA
jgi:pantoate--beta-alanine ligase